MLKKQVSIICILILVDTFSKVSGLNVNLLINHTDTVSALMFANDPNGNRYLASCSENDRINFWNTSNVNRPLIDQIKNLNQSNKICSILLASDQQLAFNYGNYIKILNLVDKNVTKILIGHSGGIYQLAISPNQQMIASASVDKTSKVWNISTGECISTMKGHISEVRSVVFYSNEILITGSYDKMIKVWKISNGNGACIKTLNGHTDYVLTLLILPKNLLASGSKEIIIWNVTSGSCLANLTDHTGYVRALVLLSNGLLASGSQDNMIRLWNLTSFNCVKVSFQNCIFLNFFFAKIILSHLKSFSSFYIKHKT